MRGASEGRAHLHQSPRLLAQLVVVLELHRDGFVAVQPRQLHVRGVAHEEGAEEIRGPDPCEDRTHCEAARFGMGEGGGRRPRTGSPTCAGSHPHDGVKADELLNISPEVFEEPLLVRLSLGGQRQQVNTCPPGYKSLSAIMSPSLT